VGLRLALGALRAQILRQFLGQGMRVSCSVVSRDSGWPAPYQGARRHAVPRVAGDPITMTGVIVLVITVSIVASLLPAAGAARVEPMWMVRE
jgi:ABC-type lipoprotein release transport system permease subunit